MHRLHAGHLPGHALPRRQDARSCTCVRRRSESERTQRAKLDFVQELNKRHRAERGEDNDLEARIAAYELAYRMQSAAPEAVDLSRETEETRRLYGLDDKTTDSAWAAIVCWRAGWSSAACASCSCTAAPAASGTRTATSRATTPSYCRESDKPIAGLLKDLKRRGLLDSTLVVWGGEFGRTPMSESGNGRDHNPFGFTIWMAGGGIKGGITYGATDEIGLYAVENRVHVHDLHATILHCLGLDHRKLTLLHNGRDERPTINGGHVVREILRKG